MSTATPLKQADLVDLAAYPVDDLASATGQALIERCRRDLAVSGALALPGFPTAGAEALEPLACPCQAEHRARRMVRSAKRGALLRALYEWDPLRGFVAAVLGEPVLSRHDDPLDGDRRPVRVMEAAPGTLALFRGHCSLRRATPGEGRPTRLMAALSYVREPNVLFSSYARKSFHARETERAAIG